MKTKCKSGMIIDSKWWVDRQRYLTAGPKVSSPSRRQICPSVWPPGRPALERRLYSSRRPSTPTHPSHSHRCWKVAHTHIYMQFKRGRTNWMSGTVSVTFGLPACLPSFWPSNCVFSSSVMIYISLYFMFHNFHILAEVKRLGFKHCLHFRKKMNWAMFRVSLH